MLTYSTEYLDDADKLHTREFGSDLSRARAQARRLSAKDHHLMVYVVATEDHRDSLERVGAEAYAYGRRDHTEGRMLPERPAGIPMRNMRDFDRL